MVNSTSLVQASFLLCLNSIKNKNVYWHLYEALQLMWLNTLLRECIIMELYQDLSLTGKNRFQRGEQQQQITTTISSARIKSITTVFLKRLSSIYSAQPESTFLIHHFEDFRSPDLWPAEKNSEAASLCAIKTLRCFSKAVFRECHALTSLSVGLKACAVTASSSHSHLDSLRLFHYITRNSSTNLQALQRRL